MDKHTVFNNMMNELGTAGKALWEFFYGLLGVVFGFLLPIKDMVNFVLLLFFVDIVVGYVTANKIRGEHFKPELIWRKTIPRLTLSVVLIILTYLWDTTFQQTILSTYTTTGWFISGILIVSIARNGFKLTRWQVFESLTGLFHEKIKEQTGLDIRELDLTPDSPTQKQNTTDEQSNL